ncbi:amidohydrolase family protein [Allobranchiibius huperziae]|uniref:Putative TIM-barrel fold metal-dependent hydrolase n=1 Tax=Allobranchiibius huperziae TaxID=1874116 RepID=A0A853DDT9_9MICO|nr:amidohydrolase family protein [Allobranchiibius huperziae]NYJ75592.1 putative TIM-barrel fold metal-dependent hydrolase [Allobranchiibius huperziae]
MTDQTSSRVIAVEEHFVTTDYWEKTASTPAPTGEDAERAYSRSFINNDYISGRLTNLQTRIDDMDKSGVDVSVLSLNPPGAQLWSDAATATSLAREMNDALAKIVAGNPTRFGALAAVAPQDPDAAADEICRAVGTLGFGGVLISCHTGGHYLDEPEYEPILAALEETDSTLYLHPRMPSPQMLEPYNSYGLQQAMWGFQAEAGINAMRLIMSGAFDRHPNLRVVLGHLGEGLPFWLWRTDNMYAKAYAWARESLNMVGLERKPSEYFQHNLWITTSGMFDQDALKYCLAKFGAERVLFAVDYPYEDSNVATQFLAEANLTDEERALISHRNA